MLSQAIVVSVLTSAVSTTGLGFLLNTFIASKINSKIAIELEKIKAEFVQELERAKHNLQLEQSRLAIIYENQRTSFTNLIRAMDDAIVTLEKTWSSGDEELSSIAERDQDKFLRVMSGESLYTGLEGDGALALFGTILGDAVGNADNQGYVPDSELRWVRLQLRFIFVRIQEYFRCRIGLAEGNPLLDVTRLAACRLLNTVRFDKAGLPTKSIFAWSNYSTVEQLIAISEEAPKELISELTRFTAYIESTDKKSFFYNYLDEARGYVRSLQASIDNPLNSGIALK